MQPVGQDRIAAARSIYKGDFMSYRLLACGLLALAAAPVFGQDTTYVQAGRLVDVVDGQLRSNQVIVISGDRIERVGSNIDIPDGAKVIDLGDMTVLPGLIDMHVHLTGDPDAQGYANLGTSIPRSALFGVANGQRTMNAGFTTVRNVGAGGFADVALRDAIDNGDVVGPRMRVAGHSLGITGGHCDNNFLPYEMDVTAGGVADGPWEIRKKVRENDKYGADLTKFCATGGVLSKGTTVGAQQYTLEEMVTIVDESHRKNRKVAAHAHGTEGIIAAIRRNAIPPLTTPCPDSHTIFRSDGTLLSAWSLSFHVSRKFSRLFIARLHSNLQVKPLLPGPAQESGS